MLSTFWGVCARKKNCFYILKLCRKRGESLEGSPPNDWIISIGNSMICSDTWHKYHEWYFEIVIRNLRQFWNITSGIYAKYHVQIMLLFVYTATRKRFVIFTCRYFKLSLNTTALSQSNCRHLSCSSIMLETERKRSRNASRNCFWDR